VCIVGVREDVRDPFCWDDNCSALVYDGREKRKGERGVGRASLQVGDRCTIVTEVSPASSISSAISWPVFAVPMTIPRLPFQEEAFL
jgi:hypothetical protein